MKDMSAKERILAALVIAAVWVGCLVVAAHWSNPTPGR